MLSLFPSKTRLPIGSETLALALPIGEKVPPAVNLSLQCIKEMHLLCFGVHPPGDHTFFIPDAYRPSGSL